MQLSHSNDAVSVLAIFQSLVYGNDALLFKEKKSYEAVKRLPRTKSNSDSTVNYLTLSNMQRTLDCINQCQHPTVSRKWHQTDSVSMHSIECEICGKELYHYAEYVEPKENKTLAFRAANQVIRSEEHWYQNVYMKCKHPASSRGNIVCKKCGEFVYCVLE